LTIFLTEQELDEFYELRDQPSWRVVDARWRRPSYLFKAGHIDDRNTQAAANLQAELRPLRLTRKDCSDNGGELSPFPVAEDLIPRNTKRNSGPVESFREVSTLRDGTVMMSRLQPANRRSTVLTPNMPRASLTTTYSTHGVSWVLFRWS
jgi:hypothetical protein